MDSIISFFQGFFETLWTFLFPSMFRVLLVFLIAFLIIYVSDLGINNFKRLKGYTKRAVTIGQIGHAAVQVIVTIFAVIMALHELGFDVRPILAGAGILSLSVSLGAQHIVKDVVNGFLILAEDQFSIGDTVKIGDYTGSVEKMNLRITTIKDSSRNTHIIPNSTIDKVSVLSKGQ